MNASGVGRKRHRGPAFGEPPTEKVETLANEQLKKLVDKQLSKETTIAEELRRKQNVCEPILVKDESSASKGFKSLSEFQMIMEKEKYVASLREHGLTEDEIEIKLEYDDQEQYRDNTSSECTNEHLKVIEEKIRKHQEFLLKPNQFTESVDVSRRDLETDSASNLSHGNTQHKFSYLVNLKEKEFSPNDPVWATLKEYEDSSRKESIEDEDSDSDSRQFIGPQLCSVNKRVDIIPEEIIIKNRLSLNDILSLERFKDYKAGEPSRVLYIKNLAKNVREEKDLAQIFARYYDEEGGSDVEYKIMNGRMRGQAFVTFKDEKTATEALLLNNGYILHGKPIIISYSKKKSDVT